MKAIDWSAKNKWLLAILVVAAFLRFKNPDGQSFWLDEVLTMMSSDPGLTLRETYKSVIFWEALPHLYFYAVKCFMAIFGYSTLNARIFSAIIGLLGVYSIYLLGKAIHNKRAGLIAAAIVSVNIFQIAYSQEARPYGLLFLFTTLSFYRLILFVRNPTTKNALLYGLFAGLIVNAHFFGILTICAQAAVLLFILSTQDAAARMRFFRLCLIAGAVIVVLILPNYEALLHVTQIKSFWIQKPGPDAFTNIFKEFFGNAEMVMYVINLLILHYLFSVFREKLPSGIRNIADNPMLLGFCVLSFWLVTSLTIAMLKSYLDVSMILPRYFINILPIFIIAAAVGVAKIKNVAIGNLVVGCLLIFSLIDIFVVRDYYNRPSKCQMREVTAALKSANTNNAKIVTAYPWIYPFWFKDKPETKFEGKTFDDYVMSLRANESVQEPFWYTNVNPYSLSGENEKYLKENFIRTKKLDFFDCWAYYYKPKKSQKQNPGNEVDLKAFASAKFSGNAIVLSTTGSIVSRPLDFEKGNYEMELKGSSPQKNHFKIKANGTEIADFYWQGENQIQKFDVSNPKGNPLRFQIIFDNGKTQQTATISAMNIVKK